MPRRAEGTQVLALGTGITLLGVLRAMSRLPVEVFALPDADRISRRSRWFKSAPRSLAGMTPATLATRLTDLPPGTILIPCSDSWARAVAALPRQLLDRYPSSIAPLSAIEILVDKSEFRATLSRLGLPHPQTVTLESIDDLSAVPPTMFRSSFLKPAHSQQFFAKFGVKAFRISDRAGAEAKLADCIREGQHMMLQEYIPGPPSNHYFIDGFVDRSGTVRALFARRRLRMSPPDFGNSTMQVSVALDETEGAIETIKALLADIRYRGIFSAEFKRDARTGVFNIIEVNARAWWYVDFAARCGVNVCAMFVDDVIGRDVETVTRYAVGRRCVFPYYDLAAVKAERAEGRVTVLDWARSWIGPYQPVFRWSDPLPASLEIALLIGNRLRHMVARKTRA